MRTCRSFVAAVLITAATLAITAAATDLALVSVTVMHRPYLQNASASAMSVLWATQENGAASLHVVPPTGNPFDVAATTTSYPATSTGLGFDYYQHEARIEGLAPAAGYGYEARVDGISAGSGSFVTLQPAGIGTVRFAAFGDSGTGRREQRQIADLVGADVAAGRAEFVLLLGDVSQGKGTYAAYHDWFFLVYQAWLGRVPTFPAIGNHDEYGYQGKPYYDVFALPGNGEPPFPGLGERYYSFDAGPVHFVALDTQTAFQNHDARRAQLAWLDTDLFATTQPWRIVYFHRPAYTVAPCCDDVRRVFAPVLERHGVQLVLSGHQHVYARSIPWNGSGGPLASAVVHVVSGGGGSTLNDADMLTDWRAVAKKTHHYVRIGVSSCGPGDSCRLDLEAIDTKGTVFDTFALDLRAKAADVEPPTVQLDEPAEPILVKGTVPVRATASDDVRVEKVDLLLDDRIIGIAPAAPYEFSWKSLGTPDGHYALRARAFDIAGRGTLSAPVGIDVANGGAWVVSPNGGERLTAGTPYTITWAASDAAEPLASFDLFVVKGKSVTPIAGCTSLPPDTRTCTWSNPGPVAGQLMVTIVGTGVSGATYKDQSNGTFRIAR